MNSLDYSVYLMRFMEQVLNDEELYLSQSDVPHVRLEYVARIVEDGIMRNPQSKVPMAEEVPEIDSEVVLANEPVCKDVSANISEIVIATEPTPKDASNNPGEPLPNGRSSHCPMYAHRST